MYIKWFMRRCPYKTGETCCTGPTDERKDGLHYHYKPSLYKVVYNWVWKRQIYIQNKVKELWSIIGYSTASNVCKFMHFYIVTIKSVCLYNFKYNGGHFWNLYTIIHQIFLLFKQHLNILILNVVSRVHTIKLKHVWKVYRMWIY